MTSPILSYDPEANALYLQFSENEVEQTIELSESVYVDLDADGMPVGLEVLDASSDILANLPSLPGSAKLKDLLQSSIA